MAGPAKLKAVLLPFFPLLISCAGCPLPRQDAVIYAAPSFE